MDLSKYNDDELFDLLDDVDISFSENNDKALYGFLLNEKELTDKLAIDYEKLKQAFSDTALLGLIAARDVLHI